MQHADMQLRQTRSRIITKVNFGYIIKITLALNLKKLNYREYYFSQYTRFEFKEITENIILPLIELRTCCVRDHRDNHCTTVAGITHICYFRM